MRKLRTFLMTLLLGASVSYANAEFTQLNFEAGYRQDDISWDFDFPDVSNPFFSTDRRFKDVEIFQIGVNGKASIGCNFYVRGEVSGGWVLSGDFEETVKFANNFSDLSSGSFETAAEFRRKADNLLDGRYVIDFSVALGYPFYFCDCMARISPVVGYAYDEQNFCLDRDDFNDISVSDSFVFPVSGSDGCCCDQFLNKWYGPFLGIDFDYNVSDCWNFFAQVEYHFAHFKGKRHSHDFSFGDSNNSHWGHGWLFKAGALYDFCNCWTAGFNVTWTDFTVTRHHSSCEDLFSEVSDFSESDFFSSSCDERRIHNSWRSFAFNLTVGYQF